MRRLFALAMTVPLIAAAASPAFAQTAAPAPPASYPQTKTVPQVDDYFGTKVADPYRWLEDDDAADTRAWVEAQNAVTFGYLSQIPERERIRQRLTDSVELRALRRCRSARARATSSRSNDGLQNQAVSTSADGLDAAPDVLLDPNTLSADGTVALGGTSFSDDGRYMAYSLAESGSDWIEWRVRDVATGKDLPDVIKWSKFSGAAWLKDGSGFFYSRYDAPKDGDALQAVNKNQKVYFHKLGTPQDAGRPGVRAARQARLGVRRRGDRRRTLPAGLPDARAPTTGTGSSCKDLTKPGRHDRAVPRRLRRLLQRRRQRRRRRSTCSPTRTRRATGWWPSTLGKPSPSRVEDADPGGPEHGRPRRRDDGGRPVRGHLA